MQLDNLDHKLLFLIDKNCRQSITKLAKQLRVHRNVVLYRIKRLEDSKIIQGYFAEIDMLKIGYNVQRVFLKLSNYTVDEEKELKNYLMQIKELMWFFKTEGKYDIDIVFASKENTTFELFLENLKIKFNNIIDTIKIGTLTQIFHYQKDYLINKKRVQLVERKFDNSIFKLEKIDESILRELTKDARANLVQVAKNCNIAINTVKEHLKKLEKNKIILGYRPFIDTEKSGYKYMKMHINLKNYNKKDYELINNFFKQNNKVIYLTKYINGDDIEAEIHIKDINELNKLKSKIISLFGKHIKEIYLLFFLDEYIYKYFPL